MKFRIHFPILYFDLLIVVSVVLAQSSPDELLQKAVDLLGSQKESEALRLMSEFKQEYPQDSRGPYVTGMALAILDRFGEAAAEFDQAVHMDPANLDYRIKAAQVQDRLGRLQQAVDRLQPVDGKNLATATSSEALWLLADLYFRQNRVLDAERVLRRYQELNPVDVRAQMRRGQIDLIEGRFEEALTRFLAVREKIPDAAPVQHAAGLAYWRLGRNEEARTALEKAVSLEPDTPGFHIDLGRFLLETDRSAEGLAELQKAEQRDPDNRDLALLLARAYRAVGDLESAGRMAARFQAEAVPAAESSVARRSSSRLETVAELLASGKVDEAHSILQEIVAEDPDQEIAHSYLAKIYISSQLFELATRHLSELKRLAPDSFDAVFLTASLYYRSRQPDQALAPALAARELRPDYADLRNLLGNIYFGLGKIELAREEYEAAVKLAPDRTEFKLNLRSVSKPQ